MIPNQSSYWINQVTKDYWAGRCGWTQEEVHAQRYSQNAKKVAQTLRLKLNGTLRREKIAGSGKGEQRTSYPQLSWQFWAWPTLAGPLFRSSFCFGYRGPSWWDCQEFYNPPSHPAPSCGSNWWGGRKQLSKIRSLHATQLLFFIEIYFSQVIYIAFNYCCWGTGEGRIRDKIAWEGSNVFVETGGPRNCWLEAKPQLLSAGLSDAETSLDLNQA